MRQVTIYATWYQPIYTESCMTILAVNGLRRTRRKFGRSLPETFNKVVTVPWYTTASIGYTRRWWRAMQESGSPLTLPFATGPTTAFAFRAYQRINSRLAFEDEWQDIERRAASMMVGPLISFPWPVLRQLFGLRGALSEAHSSTAHRVCPQRRRR
jgi:hypothetical protein